jgi:hypothetical protein
MKLNLKPTKEQCKDTGMAMVLILLILALWKHQNALTYIKIATAVLVLDMIYPPMLKPFAIVWFGFSHLLGMVMSRVILSLVFFAIVMPIGLLRRLMGKDTLQLKTFKAATASVMATRNHTFTAADLEKPY